LFYSPSLSATLRIIDLHTSARNYTKYSLKVTKSWARIYCRTSN